MAGQPVGQPLSFDPRLRVEATMTGVVEVLTDTCDQCGPHVAAYVYASFKTGSLALCGHCATAGWAKLNEQATVIIDQRHRLGQR